MSNTPPLVIPPNSTVMMFHGPGWGKTSAAIGYGIRSVGRGWSTTFIQFVKGAAWNAAEAHVAQRAGIIWPTFTTQLTWAQDPRVLCDQAWSVAQASLHDSRGGLVILDEVAHAISNEWLSIDEVLEGIKNRCPRTSVILTGQHMSEPLHGVCDTITYFAQEKHTERAGILLPEN